MRTSPMDDAMAAVFVIILIVSLISAAKLGRR
jgi:hypothetical protein